MPSYDCNYCKLVTKCGGQVGSPKDFYTAATILYCELLVASETSNTTLEEFLAAFEAYVQTFETYDAAFDAFATNFNSFRTAFNSFSSSFTAFRSDFDDVADDVAGMNAFVTFNDLQYVRGVISSATTTDIVPQQPDESICVYAYSLSLGSGEGPGENHIQFEDDGNLLWDVLLFKGGATTLGINPRQFIFATKSGNRLYITTSSADPLYFGVAWFSDKL